MTDLTGTWKYATFGPKKGKPPSEHVSAVGTVKVPAMPDMPRRDSYSAVFEHANAWTDVTDALVSFWAKVAEVLPQYYPGRAGIDPVAARGDGPFPPDNGWDRIVVVINTADAKLVTNLWVGAQEPTRSDRVWVIARFPNIHAVTRRPTVGVGIDADDLVRGFIKALRDARCHEPAETALTELRRWRDFELWVMREENLTHCNRSVRTVATTSREKKTDSTDRGALVYLRCGNQKGNQKGGHHTFLRQ